MVCCYTGESGQVYKAYLRTAVGTEIVAVKTVKGANICKSILYVFLSTIHTYVHYLFAIIQCKSISVFFWWGGGGGGEGYTLLPHLCVKSTSFNWWKQKG